MSPPTLDTFALGTPDLIPPVTSALVVTLHGSGSESCHCYFEGKLNQSKERSEKLLDLLSMSVAGMRDGVGPLLTVFLIQNTKLDPQHLSWLLAAPSFVNILAQVPVGLMLDKMRHQGWVVATGAALMALAGFGISVLPSFEWMLLIQMLAGLACCLVSVGVPAVSLSVVSAEKFGARLARNEIFSKVGNFGALALTGYVCQNFSLHAMFYVVYVFAFLLLATSLVLKVSHGRRVVDTAESNSSTFEALPVELRVGTAESSSSTFEALPVELQVRTSDLKSPALEPSSAFETQPTALSSLVQQIWNNAEFRMLVVVAFIYQFANATLFLIFEQSFVRQQKNGGAGILSSALFATQVVIILASLALAKWTKHLSPFALLGVGFFMILIRAVVFASQWGLVSLAVAQIFDGCIAAILIIVPVRAIALSNDKTFNVMSGILGTFVAFGAMLSTLSAGYIIGTWGFVPAFLSYGVAAILGGALAAYNFVNQKRRAA